MGVAEKKKKKRMKNPGVDKIHSDRRSELLSPPHKHSHDTPRTERQKGKPKQHGTQACFFGSPGSAKPARGNTQSEELLGGTKKKRRKQKTKMGTWSCVFSYQMRRHHHRGEMQSVRSSWMALHL